MAAVDQDFSDIDEAGLRRVAQIERALRALDPENIAGFVAIVNAIEVQLENSPRDPEAIRLLAQALQALVRSHGIDPRAAGFASPLEALLRYAP